MNKVLVRIKVGVTVRVRIRIGVMLGLESRCVLELWLGIGLR